MPYDVRLLFTTRIVRLFAYGFVSVILALYLAEIGLSEKKIGLLLTLTLIGDAVISLWITTSADRIGRKQMLILGSLLMISGGALFAFTDNFMILTFAAIVGVISPSGNEIGPFLSIEQSALSQLVSDEQRTKTFAWYNLAGSFATATGSLVSGGLAHFMQNVGISGVNSYRFVLIAYAGMGILLVFLFMRLSLSAEAENINTAPRLLGLHKSRKVVIKLSGLFALDAFAGGFIVQSIVAYWFYIKFGLNPAEIGSIFFAANILAGISALSAVWIAKKIGLINTMVFTHIPSNILLMLVPVMPCAGLAISVLLLRFSISQMDVPTRQSYVMAVVSPDERSAASGVTGIARSVGASVSPAISGHFLANIGLLNMPFFLAGALKIIYDLMLYRSFRKIKPPEEI